MNNAYEKLTPDSPAYDRVKAVRDAGQFACDAVAHNEKCPNPECFNFKKEDEDENQNLRKEQETSALGENSSKPTGQFQ